MTWLARHARLLTAAAALAAIACALVLKAGLMVLTERGHVATAFDSSFYLNIGTHYFESGGLTPFMWRIPQDNIVISGSGTGFGIYLLLAWFKVFGVSLAAGQRFSFLCGVLTLPLLFLALRRFWDDVRGAWAGVVFVAVSGLFQAQYFVRMDALAVLFSTAVLLGFIEARRRSSRLGLLLVGAAAVAGIELHVLGIVWVLALWLVLFVESVRSQGWSVRGLWRSEVAAFTLGAAPVSLAYAVVHVLPDPRSYLYIAKVASSEGHFGPVQELARLLRLCSEAPLETLVVGLAFAALATRRCPEDREAMLLAVSYELSLAVVNPPVSTAYSAHALPLFALIVGGALARRHGPAEARLSAALGGAMTAVLLVAAGATVRAGQKSTAPPPAAVEYVRSYVPRDVVIWGSARLFHYVVEHTRFLSYSSTWESKVGAGLRRESYDVFLERERPQVLMGTPLAPPSPEATFLQRHGFSPVWPDVWVSREFRRALEERYHPVEVQLDLEPAVGERPGCVRLRWAASDGRAELNGASVDLRGERTECPQAFMRWELSVRHALGVERREVSTTDRVPEAGP